MLDESTCKKIAQFTNVDIDAVFTSPNVDTTIYKIPIVFFEQKLDQVILRKMGVESRHADMRIWNSMMDRFSARKGSVRIGITGKYIKMHDTYTSLYEALFHASLECGVEVELVKIDSSDLEETKDIDSVFDGIDGILVPGGFGPYGINGMIKAVEWARKNKKPYFGICLGLHVMVIEWARNVLNWNDADSEEFTSGTKHLVINSGIMRLGANEIIIEDDSHIQRAYGVKKIKERHRSRFEFTNQYKDDMIKAGLKLTAFNSDGSLVECIEWPSGAASGENYPWGVAVQFHPEYKSKPMAASPLFRDFITMCSKKEGK
jgi:CTP synthase